jgi:catechol 2,3-dioxygenase
MEKLEQPGAQTHTSIHPDTHIGLVTLRVAHLDRALAFYEGVLGFQTLERTVSRAVLGTQDNTALLALDELTGAPPQPAWSTGLYHVAILLPTRPDLGRALLKLIEANWQIGQGDHLVSEALYISDPDGNGLEIYRDRPRDSWTWQGNIVKMTTDPVDIAGLMELGQRESWDILPAGTRVGHIHLQVSAIPEAERFYHSILGFDITARMPGALFVSAGGYHHHIGLNTWQSRGAGAAPEDTAGLKTFVIALPSQSALNAVLARLQEHNYAFQQIDSDTVLVDDPWHNHIQLKIEQ